MSDPSQGDPPAQTPAELRAAYDRAQEQIAAQQAQLEAGQAAQRELAMVKAGVDLDSPVGKLFAGAYQGDLEPEKIKAEWSKLGVTPGAAPTPEVNDGPTAEELAAQQAAATVTSGGATPPGEEPPGDPWKDALATRQEALKRGAPSEIADSRAIDRVMDAAAKGDPRVNFDLQRWRQEQEAAYG